MQALIASLASVVVVALTYWFTKQRERDAELRKEKLENYKAFVLSLSGILEEESSPEGQIAFSKACNNLFLFAPQAVLQALGPFQEAARVGSPNRSQHNQLYTALLLEIRKDLNIKPKDASADFRAWLWRSGVRGGERVGK